MLADSIILKEAPEFCTLPDQVIALHSAIAAKVRHSPSSYYNHLPSHSEAEVRAHLYTLHILQAILRRD